MIITLEIPNGCKCMEVVILVMEDDDRTVRMGTAQIDKPKNNAKYVLEPIEVKDNGLQFETGELTDDN